MNDPRMTFSRLRQRLPGIAYRRLGSRAEAEEVVRDAWLRWHEAAAQRREHYVGYWLPEPLLTGEPRAGSPRGLLMRGVRRGLRGRGPRHKRLGDFAALHALLAKHAVLIGDGDCASSTACWSRPRRMKPTASASCASMCNATPTSWPGWRPNGRRLLPAGGGAS